MSTCVIRPVLAFITVGLLTACGGRGTSVALTAVSATVSGATTTEPATPEPAVTQPVATQEEANTPVPASDEPTSTPDGADQGNDVSVASKDCEAVSAADVKAIIGEYTQRLNDASKMEAISGIETDCSYVANDTSDERSMYVAIYRPDKASTAEWDQYWLQQYTSSDNPAPDLKLGYYSNGSLTISKGNYYLVITTKTPETKDKANELGALEKGFALKVLARLPTSQ